MSFVTAIGTANPPHRFSQVTLANFMTRAMQLDDVQSRKLRTVFRASGIEHRHTVLEDYGREHNFSFFPNTPDFEPFPSTEKRLSLFRAHALKLSAAAVEQMSMKAVGVSPESITHLIVVCCTGMYAPGLDIELVQKLGLRTAVQRTCITFMGCYAAFNALKVANAFCTQNATAKILIVCTELCSLHFQKQLTDDNLLANALFADGAAAVLVEATSTAPVRLSLQAFCNDLAPEGSDDMAWTIGNVGFEMKLSSYVPDIIRGGIRKLTQSLLGKIAQPVEAIRYFAIHPGGKKILEAIEQELGICREGNSAAYTVLKEYGNMSSPTVLFVLAEIFRKLTEEDHDEYILSFAFGPGLTMESMLMRIQTN